LEIADGVVRLSSQMTLRDYFAAAALQGLAAKYGGADYSTFAIYAYGFADAMLAKREAE
jgi:hypothetical protein